MTVRMGAKSLSAGNSENFTIAIGDISLAGGGKINFGANGGVTAIVGSNNVGKSSLLRELMIRLQQGAQADASLSNRPKLIHSYQIRHSGTPDDVIAWLKRHSDAREQPGRTLFHKPGATNVTEQDVRSHFSPFAIGRGLGNLHSHFVFYGDASNRLASVGPQEMRDNFFDPPTSPLHVLQDSPALFREMSAVFSEVFGQPLSLDRLSKHINLRVGEPGVPAPPMDSPTVEYAEALARLPRISDQGDGMRSLVGLLLPLLTATFPVIILDEPEAFLHPPQATALGRILGTQASEKGVQIILATHDKNLISGLLQSQAEVSIVRLNRSSADETSAHQLQTSTLQDIWSDPVLRYSNILDGLFHRIVILAEADRDCRFYAAALDEYHPKSDLGIPIGEVLFVPSGGKDAFPRLVRSLKSVNVPVVVTPDLDILNDRAKLQLLVEAMGGDWDSFKADYEIATNPFRAAKDKAKVGNVLDALLGIFDQRRSEEFTAEARQDFLAQIRAKESPWASVKTFGESAFRQEAGSAAQRLLNSLDQLGIVAVRVGELEGFAPNLGVRKGPAWLGAALAAGSHKERPARRHVAALLNARFDSRVMGY